MIKAAEFARRRKQLMRMADDDSILILPAAPERIRSKDTTFPYRQDSDFWYLSGFAEPEAVLVLVPGRKHGEAFSSWRLAWQKTIECGRRPDGAYQCRATAKPCAIVQVPGTLPPGTQPIVRPKPGSA